jgi:hypothetical protein
MKDNVEAILSIHILTEKRLIELEYRSGEVTNKFGQKWYGTVDCTESLSLDELKGLRDLIDKKLKERLK